jgi:hypothetical protein
LVSVVIPCRNAAAWLSEAIESCVAQTWTNLELIVVDNLSSDATVEVARNFRHPSLAVLQCSRLGASAARNVGLEQASGEFIQFLDADDVLAPDKIRTQIERLAAAPGDSVASGAWGRFRCRVEDAAFLPEPVWQDLTPEQFLIQSWLGGGMMPNFAWLVPRAVIDRAGPWNEALSLNDDGEFFCRAALASSGIVFCPEARGYYRTGAAATLSQRRDAEALASGFRAIELSCEALSQRCNSAAAAQACATHYQRFAYDAYPEAAALARVAERRAARYGGSDLRIEGPSGFMAISRCFGWRVAKRCQRIWRQFRGRLQPV